MSFISDNLAQFGTLRAQPESSSGIVNSSPAVVNRKTLDDFPLTKGRARVIKVGLNFARDEKRTVIMITTREIIKALQAAPAFKYGNWIVWDHGIIESFEVEVLDYANGDDPDVRHQWESKFENVIYHPNSKSVR